MCPGRGGPGQYQSPPMRPLPKVNNIRQENSIWGKVSSQMIVSISMIIIMIIINVSSLWCWAFKPFRVCSQGQLASWSVKRGEGDRRQKAGFKRFVHMTTALTFFDEHFV